MATDARTYGRGPGRWALAVAAVVLVVGMVGAFVAARLTAPSPGVAQPALSAETGPTYLLDGVPLGYAHTEAGAVTAATAYLRVLESSLVAHPGRYRAAVSVMADPAARPDLMDMANSTLGDVGSTAPGLVQAVAQGRAVTLEVHAIRYHVDAYSPDQAVV